MVLNDVEQAGRRHFIQVRMKELAADPAL
jgi:hypothetical protein